MLFTSRFALLCGGDGDGLRRRSMILEFLGYHVSVAPQEYGPEASGEMDLIVIDATVPRRIEFAAEMRRQHPAARIVLLADTSQPPTVLEAHEYDIAA